MEKWIIVIVLFWIFIISLNQQKMIKENRSMITQQTELMSKMVDAIHKAHGPVEEKK